MSIIIISIVLLNMVSCFVFRKFIWRGKMILKIPTQKTIRGSRHSMTILLPGLINQPEFAFSRLISLTTKLKYVDYPVLARYSLFGWNSKTAARQLDKLIETTNSRRVDVYAICIGDKVVRQMNSYELRNIYAINPCPNPAVLSHDLQRTLPWMVRMLSIVTFIGGWLAVLPLVRFDNVRYSCALFTDQLWELGMNKTVLPTKSYKTSLILSEHDEITNNAALLIYYGQDGEPFKFKNGLMIPSKHGRTDSSMYAPFYDAALSQLNGEREVRDYVKQLKGEVM